MDYWGKQTADADLKSLSACQPANAIVCFNSNLSAKISPLRELRGGVGADQTEHIVSGEEAGLKGKPFVHGNSTNNNWDER